MSKIKLDLQRDNEATSALLEVSEATESQVDKAIDGFFSFFGVNSTPTQPRKSEEPKTAPEVVEQEPVIKAVRPPVMTVPARVVSSQPMPVRQEPVVPASKQVEIPKSVHNKIEVEGNPKSMDEYYYSVPENAPEHVKTGIKKGENGRPNRYKCRYVCPKCKSKGNHFIPEGVETVDCHKCQCSMPVKKATPGTQGIQPDRFKNWFVAGEQRPILDFEHGKAHTIK